MRLRRPSPALVVAFIGLGVALSGVAMATVPARDGDVHICYSKKSGAVEVVDTQRDIFGCERNWRGFTLDSTPSKLQSPDGRSKVEALNDGSISLTTPNSSLRLSADGKLTTRDSLELATGSATISLRKDGTITINGKDITVEGSGNVKIKGSSVTTN